MPPYSDPTPMDESVASSLSSSSSSASSSSSGASFNTDVDSVARRRRRRETSTPSSSATSSSTNQPQHLVNERVRKPSVKFASFAEYREVKHIEDYTDDDINNTWYTENEYHRIKRQCKVTVRMMTAKLSIDKNDPEFCFRGLVSAKHWKKLFPDASHKYRSTKSYKTIFIPLLCRNVERRKEVDYV